MTFDFDCEPSYDVTLIQKVVQINSLYHTLIYMTYSFLMLKVFKLTWSLTSLELITGYLTCLLIMMSLRYSGSVASAKNNKHDKYSVLSCRSRWKSIITIYVQQQTATDSYDDDDVVVLMIALFITYFYKIYFLYLQLCEYIRINDYSNGLVVAIDFRNANILTFLTKCTPMEFRQVITLMTVSI